MEVRKSRARMQRHRDKVQCKWREIYRCLKRRRGALTARALNQPRREQLDQQRPFKQLEILAIT